MNPPLTRILNWYKSWFQTSGRLAVGAYVKHIVAAYAFFFGFAFAGFGLFAVMLAGEVAWHAPAWSAWLPIAICFPLLLLAIVSWVGIIIAATMRFARHLMS
jgi:hypothetical protein